MNKVQGVDGQHVWNRHTIEIVADHGKVFNLVGGDAYSAPIVHIKETGDNPKDDYYYLHRDYLGSILAITDSDANIVEQRQFGAWGNGAPACRRQVKKMSG